MSLGLKGITMREGYVKVPSSIILSNHIQESKVTNNKTTITKVGNWIATATKNCINTIKEIFKTKK